MPPPKARRPSGFRIDCSLSLLFDRLPDDELDRLQQLPAGKRLLCCRCVNPITDIATQIPVSGSHQRQFSNPAGQSFRIGCFANTPGCSLQGKASSEHNWFPGYRRTVALLARCGNPLGWRFQGNNRFFGLILDQRRTAG